MSEAPPGWFMIGTLAVSSLAPIVSYVVASRQVGLALKVARQQAKSAEAVAQKNFQGSIVSANRQRWLDELRSDVATFVSEVMAVKAHGATADSERLRAVHFTYARVRMRINSSKPDQNELVVQMKSIMKNINTPDLNEKLEDLMKSVEAVAASVWRKVKAGD